MSTFTLSVAMDGLIRAIYQGPLEDTPWLSFLSLLREAMGANYATLVLRPPSEGDTGLVFNAIVVSPEVYHSYNETWFSLDPFVVFSKTGLTRQTKLIQLILKSVAPFGA